MNFHFVDTGSLRTYARPSDDLLYGGVLALQNGFDCPVLAIPNPPVHVVEPSLVSHCDAIGDALDLTLHE